jgi:hypothetical protein
MEGLKKLREPFLPNQISKLPKPTSAQTAEVKADYRTGIRCTDCGGWHHKDVIHLDYVGHAAITDRFLDCDESWDWQPLAFDDLGLPLFDKSGGLWIKLTICGVTRLGYGHAKANPSAEIGSREKEVIGDALRNAAMRFGAALDLWHKGELHPTDPADEYTKTPRTKDEKEAFQHKSTLVNALDVETLRTAYKAIPAKFKTGDLEAYARKRAYELTPIPDKINSCTTMENLTAICDTLTEDQSNEYSDLISSKIDNFTEVK